jgi:hemolysin activation/secretion protein
MLSTSKLLYCLQFRPLFSATAHPPVTLGQIGWAALLAFFVAGSVQAQTPPKAGTLERQIRQDSNRPPTAAPVLPAAPAKGLDRGVQVTVRRILVEGATLIPADTLAALLADRIGQSLTLNQLEQAAQVIAAYYRSHGYFARVYLPAQDVTDGTLRIRVVEGHLGAVKMDNRSQRADMAFVQRVVTRDLAPDAPYSAVALERGLLLANDLSGIRTSGVLEAGQLPATSDLNLTVEDEALVTGFASTNNFGTQATGEYQANAGVAINNLTGKGDLATLRALAAERLAFAQLGYELPLGSDGWRAGAQGSFLKYRLGDSFSDLDAKGTARTLTANLSYPLLRSVQHSLWIGLALSDRHYADDVLDTDLHRKHLNDAALSLNGNLSDGLGGGGLTRYSVRAITGKLDLSDVETDLDQDRAGPGSDGQYAKIQVQINRDQRLGANWFVRGRAAGQATSTNLDSSEKFALGGPDGVRAYPVNEGTGDQGVLFNLELHRPMGNWDASLFADAGRVFVDQDPWYAAPTRGNSYWLKGAGAALDWTLPGNFNINLTVAAPLGDNGGEPSPDHNQDGRRRDTRGWFSLTKLF